MTTLATEPMPVSSAYSLFREGKLIVNRKYQRKLVWTLEEKKKLIESIESKYPIPAIILAEKDSGNYFEVIDGLQRLHAIFSFIENGYSNLNEKYFDIDSFPLAKSYSRSSMTEKAGGENEAVNSDNILEDSTGLSLFSPNQTGPYLNIKEIGEFLSYNLSFLKVKNASEKEINDIFSRINTYGHRLSDQERRQAGVENEFSRMVRLIAEEIRGDASNDTLPLLLMPSISIDMPKTKHGYQIKAEDVFWVAQGILRSNDLRDSMDEQCIADIAACCIGDKLIDRSKSALDSVYDINNPEFQRISAALKIYTSKKFSDEFIYCLGEIQKICDSGSKETLRNILFPTGNANPFHATFAIIMIALHEMIARDSLVIKDYEKAKIQLRSIMSRINTKKSATTSEERRNNVETVKALLKKAFVKNQNPAVIYENHSIIQINSLITRSSIELSDYELKQGILRLDDSRTKDDDVFVKVINTICGIANNGKNRTGKIIIGVADKLKDVQRIKQLDGIQPVEVGSKYVVGVNREAKKLNITKEEYFTLWKNAIKNSELSNDLKMSVLSNIDFNDYYGLGLIIITINSQERFSQNEKKIYWRAGDSTVLAEEPEQIAQIVQRFQ